MYFCGNFNLDDWDDEAKFIILDDIDISFFPRWKEFLGCQKQFVLTDKYRRKRTVHWGRPCVWLCNADLDPRRTLSRVANEWLSINVFIYESDEKLYV